MDRCTNCRAAYSVRWYRNEKDEAVCRHCKTGEEKVELFYCSQCEDTRERNLVRVLHPDKIICVDCFDRHIHAQAKLITPLLTPCAYCATYFASAWSKSKKGFQTVCNPCSKK